MPSEQWRPHRPAPVSPSPLREGPGKGGLGPSHCPGPRHLSLGGQRRRIAPGHGPSTIPGPEKPPLNRQALARRTDAPAPDRYRVVTVEPSATCRWPSSTTVSGCPSDRHRIGQQCLPAQISHQVHPHIGQPHALGPSRNGNVLRPHPRAWLPTRHRPSPPVAGSRSRPPSSASSMSHQPLQCRPTGSSSLGEPIKPATNRFLGWL